MKLQQLYSYTRKAIDHYQLIESGDKIAIGISGGKDSLTLLYALSGLRRFYPQKFDLVAVTVDLGYENFDLTAVSKLCHDLDVPYHIVNTEIAKILFEERNEKPTCSLCAKMRSMVKRLLKKYKYPPEGQEEALETVISQCEMWTDNTELVIG